MLSSLFCALSSIALMILADVHQETRVPPLSGLQKLLSSRFKTWEFIFQLNQESFLTKAVSGRLLDYAGLGVWSSCELKVKLGTKENCLTFSKDNASPSLRQTLCFRLLDGVREGRGGGEGKVFIASWCPVASSSSSGALFWQSAECSRLKRGIYYEAL